MMSFDFLESILCVFLIALFVTVVFRQIRLSVILGYLIVGTLVGPHGLKLIPNSQSIKELAEFGIVFLMFTVGLEFSLPKLLNLKYPVFVIGGIQVLLCIAITALCGMLLGMSVISSVIVGGIVAMSSTAIVVKQLNDQRELHSIHGLNAMGILLFQDLAVIPFLILVSGLAKQGDESLTSIFLLALFKGIVAILLIYILGTWLLRPLFRMIAKTRAVELFTLAVLLVTLTSAWLTHLFGLSFALGAFLAGIMLAETEFRHQIEVEIRPFRDILLGLFFITIGMLADISTWSATAVWIILLLIAIVLGKMVLIIILSRLCRYSLPTSFRTGLILAQGGEFGFAILTLSLSENIIPAEYSQVILAALLLSILLSPILIYFNEQIAEFFLKKHTPIPETPLQNHIVQSAKKLNQHVILCGYGRVGQHIARILDKINTPYIGIDLDPELVHRASLAGDNVIYGDSTHPIILKKAGLKEAKVLVISLPDLKSAKKILSLAKQIHPSLPVLVRCRDEVELMKLKDHGATHVIAELFEESLTLSHHLMHLMKIPASKILNLIQDVRNKDYDLLHRVFTGSYEQKDDLEAIENHELRPILIPEDAFAVNHSLRDFNFNEINIEVIAIRRGNEKQIKPHSNVKISANDILILFGEIQNLEKAERMLLEG